MLALGLILVLIAVVVVVYVTFATVGLDAMPIDWGIFTAELTPLQLFLLGAGTVLVLAIGTAILAAGLRRQTAKRAEVRRLRKEVKASGRQDGSDTSTDRVSSHRVDREPDRVVDSDSTHDGDSGASRVSPPRDNVPPHSSGSTSQNDPDRG